MDFRLEDEAAGGKRGNSSEIVGKGETRILKRLLAFLADPPYVKLLCCYVLVAIIAMMMSTPAMRAHTSLVL